MMGLFSRRPLTSRRLIVCIAINLLATPGLGSLMARRFVAGIGQLALAVGGSGLVVVWICEAFYRMTMDAMGQPSAQPAHDWLFKYGAIIFGVSWVWALITSVSLWTESWKLEQAEKNVPPKLKP